MKQNSHSLVHLPGSTFLSDTFHHSQSEVTAPLNVRRGSGHSQTGVLPHCPEPRGQAGHKWRLQAVLLSPTVGPLTPGRLPHVQLRKQRPRGLSQAVSVILVPEATDSHIGVWLTTAQDHPPALDTHGSFHGRNDSQECSSVVRKAWHMVSWAARESFQPSEHSRAGSQEGSSFLGNLKIL